MSTLAVEPLIRRKRDGGRLSHGDIEGLISGITNGTVPDYQTAALLMAIYFRGLDDEELGYLLEAMTQSGRIVDLSALPGAKIDKHSTGGVGDKISLCLAPAVAACGVCVPMIAGRGLGHTGGTLDKLEAIRGMRTDLSLDRFCTIVERHGFAFGGQTEDIAPADRILYALRDVTATVESVPLIASSILSKKLAEGIDGLVLDVKVGRGAFMKDIDHARVLAQTLVTLATNAGKRAVALLTDMDDPIGTQIGNLSEAWEAVEVMRGRGPDDTVALTVELGAEMLVLGHAARTLAEGRDRIKDTLTSGAALDRFFAVVAEQGGDPSVFEGPLPYAAAEEVVLAPRTGVIAHIDALGVGRVAMAIGAGRQTKDDKIDPLASVVLLKKRGQHVEKQEPIARIYAHRDPARSDAGSALAECFQIAHALPATAQPPLFRERIA